MPGEQIWQRPSAMASTVGKPSSLVSWKTGRVAKSEHNPADAPCDTIGNRKKDWLFAGAEHRGCRKLARRHGTIIEKPQS